MARSRSKRPAKRQEPEAGIPPWALSDDRPSDTATREGEVQLNLGRSAHGAGIALLLAYFITGFLASIIAGLPPGTRVAPFFDNDTLLVLLPLCVGIVVGTSALILKWVHLPSERAAGHMAVSALAVILPVTLLIFVVYGVAYTPLVTPAYLLHPLAGLGPALAILGLALSWSGRGGMKGASVSGAVLVPILLLGLVLFRPPTTSADNALALTLFLSGALFQVSGSLLHLLATSTRADHRAILKSSQIKIRAIETDIERKRQALAFQEKALAERDTDLEMRERNALEIEATAESRTKELEAFEAKAGNQFRELKELESVVLKGKAQLEAKTTESAQKERELREREATVQQSKRIIETRETAAVQRENETKRKDTDLKTKETRIVEMDEELKDFEGRLHQENESLDAKRSEVFRMGKELELRESALKMQIEQLEAMQAADEEVRIREIRDYQDKVMAKEREVANLEVAMKALEMDLRDRESRLTSEVSRLREERDSMKAKEDEFRLREETLSHMEADMARRSQELNSSADEVREEQNRMAQRSTNASELFENSKVKEVELESLQRDLADRVRQLEDRERQSTKIKESLSGQIKDLNLKHREMLMKEKDLERREQTLGVRELETDRLSTNAAAVKEADDARTIDLREKKLREREEELRRRNYEKEKELELREQALKERDRAASTDDDVEEVQVTPVATGEKVKTGTRRFDDLFLGGIPFNAHIAFIGPAFAGKEVLLYNFIAEGLRTKIPAVIVTTGRPPVDVQREMAPVLPSLLDYDRLGLIQWVDASEGGKEAKNVREGNIWKVSKPTDHEGIYKAISAIDEELVAKGFPYFRLAILTLSNAVARSNEEAGVSFVQKLVNRLRQTKCVSIFAIEKGMHSEPQLQSLEHIFDGAVLFEEKGTKRFLSVHGIGDVQTRNWVEYTSTNKAIMLRAFTLERIR